MSRGSDLDHRVKNALVQDTVALIDPLPFDREKLVQILERRRQSVRSRARKSAAQETAADVEAILMGRVPRKVGEPPRNMGNFECIAPGTVVYSKCCKMKAAVSNSSS